MHDSGFSAVSSGEMKQKSSKAPIITAVVCAILGVAGVAFGVYGMVRANSSASVENMKVEVKAEDGTLTTLEADKIETKTEDGKTVTIVETPALVTKNPVFEQSQHVELTAVNESTHSVNGVDIYVANGKITKCELFERMYSGGYYTGDKTIGTCAFNIDGEISRLVEGSVGAGSGASFAFFIMADGSVYYANVAGEAVHKLEIDDFVTDAFSSQTETYVADTVFITNNGKVVLLSNLVQPVVH